MKINFGIIALSVNDKNEMRIHHFCGYEDRPDEDDIALLGKELNKEEQYGLVGRIGKDIQLLEAPEAVVQMYAKEISFKTNRQLFRYL